MTRDLGTDTMWWWSAAADLASVARAAAGDMVFIVSDHGQGLSVTAIGVCKTVTHVG
jgi:hypothetical protein